MKRTTLLLAAAAGFLLAGFAQAQTKVYISGAPAFRQVGTTAIQNVLAAGGGNITTAITGSNILTASQVTFYGGNIGGAPVTIKVSYTGSASGIQATSASGITVPFLADGASGTGIADPTVNTNPHEDHTPDFTLADEYQFSTPWIGTNNLRNSTTTTYATLTAKKAGILTYKWVANADAPAGLNNITPNQAQTLFKNGSIPLSQFTADPNDEGTLVYLVGRDIGSGARTIALQETGVGSLTQIRQQKVTTTVSNTVKGIAVFAPGSGYTSAPTVTIGAPTGTSPVQATASAQINAAGQVTGFTIINPGSGYIATPSVGLSSPPTGGTKASGTAVVGGQAVTAYQDYPTETVVGVPQAVGNSGYGSFTNVLNAITATSNTGQNAQGVYFLTYLASPDAATAIAGGAKELTWNGHALGVPISPSTASVNVAEGKYTYWSYIFIDYLPSLNNAATAVQYNTATAVFNQLHDVDALVLLKDVKVTRAADGGAVN